MADWSEPAARTAALSRLAALGGCGFVFGPSLAGQLGQLGVEFACLAHVVLAVVVMGLAAVLQPLQPGPEPQPRHSGSGEGAITAAHQAAAASATTGLLAVLLAPPVLGLLLASFFLSFGFQAFTSTFFLYCKRRFDFGGTSMDIE
jgi:hypothetical protein